MADELRVDLDEREDRDGKMYLFGSIRIFNSVMFVRKDRHGNWHATFRAYQPRAEKSGGNGVDKNQDSVVWDE